MPWQVKLLHLDLELRNMPWQVKLLHLDICRLFDNKTPIGEALFIKILHIATLLNQDVLYIVVIGV